MREARVLGAIDCPIVNDNYGRAKFPDLADLDLFPVEQMARTLQVVGVLESRPAGNEINTRKVGIADDVVLLGAVQNRG